MKKQYEIRIRNIKYGLCHPYTVTEDIALSLCYGRLRYEQVFCCTVEVWRFCKLGGVCKLFGSHIPSVI